MPGDGEPPLSLLPSLPLAESLVQDPGPVTLKVSDLLFGEFAGLGPGGRVFFSLSDDLVNFILQQSLAPLARALFGQG